MFSNMGATMKTLEDQIGQLTLAMKEQSSRSFPISTEENPKECKYITLRSVSKYRAQKWLMKGRMRLKLKKC